MSAIFALRRVFLILFVLGGLVALILYYSVNYFTMNQFSNPRVKLYPKANIEPSRPGIENIIIDRPSRVTTTKAPLKSWFIGKNERRRPKKGETLPKVIGIAGMSPVILNKEERSRVRVVSGGLRSQRTKVLTTTTVAPPKILSRSDKKEPVIDVNSFVDSSRLPVQTTRKDERESGQSTFTRDSNLIEINVPVERNERRLKTEVVTFPPPTVAKPLPTVRPRSCDHCMTHDFRILILPSPCDRYRPPELILTVISSPQNTDMRKAIRKTWGRRREGRVKVVFLFGVPKEDKYNSILKAESEKHSDILQEDFIDSYGNLTYKTMMAFKFLKNHCARARYVMKTDDDMWINVPQFFRTVEHKDMSNSIGGMCILNAAPIRDTNSRWYASYRNYPESKYPGFCSGTAYFMKVKTAIRIFDVSPDVPFFYLEDVYVSLCAERIHVQLKPVVGFHNYRVAPGTWCHYKTSSLISSHGMSADELLFIEDRC